MAWFGAVAGFAQSALILCNSGHCPELRVASADEGEGTAERRGGGAVLMCTILGKKNRIAVVGRVVFQVQYFL
jgi:hypothetical protein